MHPVPRLAAALVTVAILATGCGSSDGDGGRPPAQPAPSGSAQDFPKPGGKTMSELLAALHEGPVFAPSVSLLTPGRNRIGFGLFNVAGKQIAGASAALYVSAMDGSGVRGPFVARSESLAVKPRFLSRTSSQDPNAAKSVYVADVPLQAGKYIVTAVARMDGRLLSTSPRSVEVTRPSSKLPPAVGDRAIDVHTDTLAKAGGAADRVTTRLPPDNDLIETDLASVLGKKPVVLLFATPALCVSRVCGPVVDVAEQVKAAVGDKVAFIHQEIYKDNQIAKGFRAPVKAYRLPTEPWFFVIDRKGRISSRFEGAISVGELERAVAKVTAGA